MPADKDYWGDDHDPYTDERTGVLKNIPGFDSAAALEKFEATLFQANFPEASVFAAGLQQFNLAGWQQLHKICFGDVMNGRAKSAQSASPKAIRFSHIRNISKAKPKNCFRRLMKHWRRIA